MASSTNQFIQTPEVGYLDLQTAGNNVLSCLVASNVSAALVPGQTVKTVDDFSDIPTVTNALATELAWGVVMLNNRRPNSPASSVCEVARAGTVMFMQASGAIARDANVQYNPATNKVATQTGTSNTILGKALDKAAADGDIIRVIINPAPAPTV